MEMARDISIDIQRMSLALPKFEQFEAAQQIRKSGKSVRSTIVEGYGRRSYKADFIKFIIYALASNEEIIDHLETLYETNSLTNEEVYSDLHLRLGKPGRKINNSLQSVPDSHLKPSDGYTSLLSEYISSSKLTSSASSIQYPIPSI